MVSFEDSSRESDRQTRMEAPLHAAVAWQWEGLGLSSGLRSTLLCVFTHVSLSEKGCGSSSKSRWTVIAYETTCPLSGSGASEAVRVHRGPIPATLGAASTSAVLSRHLSQRDLPLLCVSPPIHITAPLQSPNPLF